MKRIIVVFTLLFSVVLFNESSAQVVAKGYMNPAMKVVPNSKTYVVLTGDETFDTWLRGTMDKTWTVTVVQYITATELDTLAKSDKNVFFFAQSKDDKTASMHLLTSADFAAKKDMTFLLSLGGFKQAKYMYTPATGGAKIISYCKFSPERADITAGMFEAEILIAFMNQSLQTVFENHIKTAVKDSVKLLIDRNATEIVDKILLINATYSDGTIELDKKVLISDKTIEDYPYAHQTVTKYSLDSVLNSGSDFVYLLMYFPSAYVNQADDSGDILIYDPNSRKILYYEDNFEGPWMEKWELKDMVYASKGKF